MLQKTGEIETFIIELRLNVFKKTKKIPVTLFYDRD